KRSRVGLRALHGPHHSAQKSTTTGVCRDFSRTSLVKLCSLTSITKADFDPTAIIFPFKKNSPQGHRGREFLYSLCLCVSVVKISSLLFGLFHSFESSANMRDRYRAPDNKRHIKCLQEFIASHAFFHASDNVIGYAIITPENQRCDQSHQLLCFCPKRTWLVRLMVQRKKPLQSQISAA